MALKKTVQQWCHSGSLLVERGSRAAARMGSGASTTAVCALSRRVSSAASGVIRRKALDNAVAGEHAAVDGEVAADHEGTHGGILLGQSIGLVGQVGLVFAAVDEDMACEAAGVTRAFVGWVHPSAAPAKA